MEMCLKKKKEKKKHGDQKKVIRQKTIAKWHV